jgi:TPP-dependent pyruvate/acetoin dehydrogenase alpha subunit
VDRDEDTLKTIERDLKAMREMLRIRMVELEIANRYPEQEMRTPVHLCVGQEATPVGVSQTLRASDKVMSGHRSHGHYLAKGGDLAAMIAEIYGKDTGCSRGYGGSQHLIDLQCGFLGSAPILASTLSIGTGVAWALQGEMNGDVCVVYFGDAAVEEGVFYEATSFAALHSLPIVYVCENNLYSTHTHISARQPNRPIANLALASAFPSETVDGNDVVEVGDAAARAINRAREGGGPTLLVADTYRWLEHVGPDDDSELGYRTTEEIDMWKLRDPLEILAERIKSRVDTFDELRQAWRLEIQVEIDQAFRYALQSPFPDPALIETFVFPGANHG